MSESLKVPWIDVEPSSVANPTSRSCSLIAGPTGEIGHACPELFLY